MLDDARIDHLMLRALSLAERGGGATAPNPMVGCILADVEGRILGEGYHSGVGAPHAEIEALHAARAAGYHTEGATAIVTLEPCAHQGRTPPCVAALAETGVVRVIYAMSDPQEGRGGAERLRQSDIAASGGVREAEARRLNEAWLHFSETGQPLIHLKTAQTLNARVTRGREEERWVTGPAARAVVHRLRRRHRAVMVGVGTVLADDPLLTVREWPPGTDTAAALEDSPDADDLPWPDVQPLRIVLDTRLRTPLASRLARTTEVAPVLVFCGPDAPAAREAELAAQGVEVSHVREVGAGLDLVAIIEELARRGVSGVLVEPGPTLATALLESSLVDRWTMFLTPDWIATRGALPLLLTEAPHTGFTLTDVAWGLHGRDASVSGRLVRDPIAAPEAPIGSGPNRDR